MTTWRGKDMCDMTKEELIQALSELNSLYMRTLLDHKRDLEILG